MMLPLGASCTVQWKESPSPGQANGATVRAESRVSSNFIASTFQKTEDKSLTCELALTETTARANATAACAGAYGFSEAAVPASFRWLAAMCFDCGIKGGLSGRSARDWADDSHSSANKVTCARDRGCFSSSVRPVGWGWLFAFAPYGPVCATKLPYNFSGVLSDIFPGKIHNVMLVSMFYAVALPLSRNADASCADEFALLPPNLPTAAASVESGKENI